jgi:hypothetical protein
MNENQNSWSPKQGEQCWFKVFSNWSLGTYIGYDVIVEVHIGREAVEGGGYLLSSSQILPWEAMPNQKPKIKTISQIAVMEVESVRQMWEDPTMEMDMIHTLNVLKSRFTDLLDQEKGLLKLAHSEGARDKSNFDKWLKETFKLEE